MKGPSRRTIERAISELTAVLDEVPNGSEGEFLPGSPADRAKEIYRLRRKRDVYFDDPDLFGEPIYDILLDLYVAYAAGIRVSVSSACIAASVPATTALRSLTLLEQRELIARQADPCDKRRYFVELTSRAVEAVEAWLTP